jgi:hypothetical protein
MYIEHAFQIQMLLNNNKKKVNELEKKREIFITLQIYCIESLFYAVVH